MTMSDCVNILPRCIDGGMNEAFRIKRPIVRAYYAAFEIKLNNIAAIDQSQASSVRQE